MTERPSPLATSRRVAVSGASGLLGRALSAALRERGDEVVSLTRSEPSTPDEIRWDTKEYADSAALEQLAARIGPVDAFVHLAGAGVADHRWTSDYKQVILRSRVDGTQTVAALVAAQASSAGSAPRLLSGSAIGYYGSDRGDEVLSEDSGAGRNGLAQVCLAWEAATEEASTAGAPVAHLRTGLVMSADGGAFQRILLLARLGLAGPMGSGRQWWSWVTRHDHVRAMLHLLDHPEVCGPVNLVGPEPARQADLVREIARGLHRPALVPAPALALRVALGGFASEVVGSQRVVPDVLRDTGFRWDQSTPAAAAAALVSGAADR